MSNLKKIAKIDLVPFELKNNCECKTKSLSVKQSVGKPLRYPHSHNLNENNIIFKTVQIKYKGKLSLIAKFLLNSFQNKYLYYAIDDILYLLKSDKVEQNNLLMILYSPIIFLQNNFSINFFDIWIHEIYINNIPRKNKFLKENFESSSYITIEFFYLLPTVIKKQKTIW